MLNLFSYDLFTSNKGLCHEKSLSQKFFPRSDKRGFILDHSYNKGVTEKMSQNTMTPYAKGFSRLTIGFIFLTILVYILRGVGILTFIPGGIIYLLFLSAIGFGLLSKLARWLRW